ncbi:MAG: DUF349 domain-containing protein [Candidatus Competibacteraceae bacterium]|nr:DUF349 domain-containing protein [Candidatus Competibacteraceae bacterium]
MILSRFLKPKWRRTEPADPQQALRDLDRADPKLVEIARHDPDPAMRRTALERLVDLDALQGSADADGDDGLRALARDRYRDVLAGKVGDGPPLAERLERLRAAPDAELIDFLLWHATEPELRLAALTRIEAAPALVEIALQNPHQDLRAAALERIEDPEALERIVRQSRNRDKRLYRRARERLDERLAAQARTDHQERLCAEMEQLLWDGESGPNAGRFPKLEQEWRGQEATASEAIRERYAQARARFLAERQASAGRRTQRLELVARLESLLERSRQETQADAELAASIQQALQETPVAWAQLGPAQDAESRRLEQRFQHLTHDIKEQERILHRNQLRAERLHEVLKQAEALLEQPSEVREIDLKQLRQRWDGLERPESRELSSQLQNRLDGLLDKLRARLQRQVQQRDQEWQELQELASHLETALEEGELQHATDLHDQARQRLKHNIGLTRAQMATVEERLQHCAGRIGELRDWRRWGTHQAREQLCIAAEQLVGLEADPAEIAQRIQQTRAAWKALDHREGAAPKALWKRFNEACERAYAPCQAHFEAQNRERLHNLEKKQALCEQLEQFEAVTDWDQVDWREADRLRQRARENWHKLGPVNRADRKTLDRRFQQVSQRLDARLHVEREREIQRRQQLVEHVRSLLESPDLRTAIEAAKRAQAEWHPTVQAPPSQEQALWKEFRAVCDAVFARRQSEQQAADAERQTQLSRRLELCAEVEALATVDHAQLASAQARLQAAQEEWETLGAPPKSEQRALNQRFETAIRQFVRHERLLRQTGTRESFKNLHARSRLCARLERLLALAPVDAGLIAQDRDSWTASPSLPDALLEPIRQRFDAAAQALTETPERAPELIAALERNLERKRIWCLCMEIVAGVESPPEWAQQRMEYQVARLSASLAGASANNGDALYDPGLLQEQWCLTGALPAEPEAALDARFLDALRAWQQREEL